MATIYVWGKYNIKTELELMLEAANDDQRDREDLDWDDQVLIGTSYELYPDPDDPSYGCVKVSGTTKVLNADETGGYEGWFMCPNPPYNPSHDYVDIHYGWICELYNISIGGNYNRLFFYERFVNETEVKSKGNYITDVTSTNRSKYPDNGMDNNEEYWYVYKGIQNTAPTTPSSITVPSTLKENVAATISWGTSTDTDGNLSGYILEQQLNGGSWTQVYKGSARSKSITPLASWNTVVYRVKAYDTENAMSSYKTSSTVTVQHNTAPTVPKITVPATIKGGTSIKITWTASTDADNNLSGYILERKFDSGSWTQVYKGSNLSYTDPIPLDKYKTVTYRVKAYDTENAESSYSTSATKNIQNSTVLQFRLKTPIESPKRAAYGQEIMTYTIPSGATFKAEACNNGFDENPTWEDITEFVKKQKLFEFNNKSKTASKWGYDIRVTVDRNGATGDCYFTRGNGFFEEDGYIPPDSNTLLLIHGSSLNDVSQYSVSTQNVNVTISKSITKFGNGSMYFNGSARLLHDEIMSKIANHDFTIDWWEYCTNTTSCSRYSSIYGGTTDFGGLLLGYGGTEVYCSSTLSGQWDLVNKVTMFSNTLNTWVHWAIVRKGNILYSFKNGKLFKQTNITGTICNNKNYKGVIGDYRSGDPDPFIGYIEEFRISDVARWTTGFTPPTKPY